MILSVSTAFYLACAGIGVSPVKEAWSSTVEVSRFSFEQEDDENYDHQPDEWTRRRGSSFPHYVQAMIDRNVAAHGKQSLRFDINGGQAAYYSPFIRVDETHSYVLRGQIRTEALQHDAAIISISLLDHKRHRVQRILSRPVSGTHAGWVSVEIGPVRPKPEVRFLVIGCHIAEGDKGDIRGHAWFDDLWLGCLPRLELATDSGRHYFKTGEPIGIEVEVPGLAPDWTCRLLLSLEDASGKVLDQSVIPLENKAGDRLKPRRWEPAEQPNGFYRVKAALVHESVRVLEKETTFVVMDPGEEGTGEFGWSVSSGPGEMPLERLGDVASHAGINWLKLPLWSAVHQEQKNKTSELAPLIEQLERHNITLVGLLNDPPPQVTEKFAQNWVGMSKIFTMPREFWYPSLETIIARYSFRIRHWQLGGEDDGSFIGLQSLPSTIAAVKNEFDRIGHDTSLGYHWDWKYPLPRAADARHSFLSMSSTPSLNAIELQDYVVKSKNSGVTRWVLIKPLDRVQHQIDVRTIDLTRRMVAAKIGLGRGEAVFVANPLDPATGMLNADGSPTELFLPWRTMALALRGATYIGRFDFPNYSPNAVFARKNEVVVIAWNDKPTEEKFFLGDKAYVTDLWGHRVEAPVDETKSHTLSLGPTPIIVRGCSEAIARWRLAVRFEKGRIPSEYGEHTDAILAVNTFPQSVSGNVVLKLPQGWSAEPPQWQITAGAGDKLRFPSILTFPRDASLGQFRPTIEFELAAERPYKFTVQLPYELGLGDVELEMHGKRTAEGKLEIEQRIVNNTEPLEILNFNCSLFIPGRVRQRQTVAKLGRGEDKRFYYVPWTDDLKGAEVLLRAEQLDGQRLLNVRFIVTE